MRLGFVLVAISIAGIAYAVSLFNDSPPHPDEWLTEADVEALAETLSTYDGWVAGCVLNGRDDAPIEAPGSEVISVTVNGRDAVLFHNPGVPVSLASVEVLRPGAYCRVPEGNPLLALWGGQTEKVDSDSALRHNSAGEAT